MTSHDEPSRDRHRHTPIGAERCGQGCRRNHLFYLVAVAEVLWCGMASLRRSPMNGPELLEHVAGLVTRRRREYGEPVEVFDHIAQRWSLTLGSRVSSAQVLLCLIDLKLTRLARDPKHLDSIVDVAGYPAVLQEVVR